MKAAKRKGMLAPWARPALDPSEQAAIYALARGTADAHQQRLAFEVIRVKICGESSISYYPGGEDGRRATDYAEGKRFVGLTMGYFARREGPIDLRGEPPAMPQPGDD